MNSKHAQQSPMQREHEQRVSLLQETSEKLACQWVQEGNERRAYWVAKPEGLRRAA